MRERLSHLIEPAVESLGYELVLLEFSPGLQTGTLRLYIDAPKGVALEDCEKVSREVAALLDVEDPIQKAYRLEVSSPGLDRPLVKLAHFQRFLGEKVRLQLLAPVQKRKKLLGVLRGASAETLVIEVDGESLQVPMADLERARLVPDFAKEFSKKGSSEQEDDGDSTNE
ncbi:ribosome maturation factor RimP [Stagnimonas aquatica]|uniref:Ribosome maturation factor RimP n=1 Tax=Stagnimonas aquatica TaxID=2689987 RepID=A0A3N0VEU4_9GAMM|nr:ribosome maturation factor RimP [Stagnimonas aquatica]